MDARRRFPSHTSLKNGRDLWFIMTDNFDERKSKLPNYATSSCLTNTSKRAISAELKLIIEKQIRR